MTTSLQGHLERWAGDDPARADVAATVAAIAGAAAELSGLIALGPLAGALATEVGSNKGGDAQKALDVEADRLLLAALRSAPVAALASEEADEAVPLREGAPLAVALDPLDGSSNIDTNVSIGTIFSILPAGPPGDPGAAFRRPGSDQLAAGFVVYGPQTCLVLTLRQGVDVFTLDRREGGFMLTRAGARIPPGKREYAINASNYQYWSDEVRAYVDDCVAGRAGPRGADFNMRWIASLVAEAFRILARGGVFLYPGDSRPGYGEGRLRLLYEAAPLALVTEEAGGAATDGAARILDLVPRSIHQRTPLVFGAADEVGRVAGYADGSVTAVERSPLFRSRGLFRA